MPLPETDKQRRWSFAAEARGELPKGTARRWAHETRLYKLRKLRTKGKRPGCTCKHCRVCTPKSEKRRLIG